MCVHETYEGEDLRFSFSDEQPKSRKNVRSRHADLSQQRREHGATEATEERAEEVEWPLLYPIFQFSELPLRSKGTGWVG